MEPNIFFWWSVVSTIISLALLFVSMWQYLESRHEKKRHSSQIKIWMQDANGIHWAMMRIVQDNLDKRYSSTSDIANSVYSLDSSIFALYQSLYEERCIDEEDYKKEQVDIRQSLKKESKSK